MNTFSVTDSIDYERGHGILKQNKQSSFLDATTLENHKVHNAYTLIVKNEFESFEKYVDMFESPSCDGTFYTVGGHFKDRMNGR